MKGGCCGLFRLHVSTPKTYRVWFSGEGPRNLHECLCMILWPSIVWEPLFFSLTALLSSLPPFLYPLTVPFLKALSRAAFYCALPGSGTSVLWLEHTALEKPMDRLLPLQALFKTPKLGCSDVSVVKNPPANAGDMGLVPDPTRSPRPQSS